MNRLLLPIAIALTTPRAPAAESTKPNVVIVIIDDQGIGDFSFTGNPISLKPVA